MDSTGNGVNDNLCCRICLEDGERRDFIAPCACTGSQKWVHRACLDKWRSIREDKAFSRCTECLKQYTLVCSNLDDGSLTSARRCRFFTLVTRDFGLALCVSQLVVVSLALLVFACDAHSHVLIEALKQTGRPVLFYYSMGLLLSLSLLGMWFTIIQMGCCGDGRGGDGGCCDCAGPGAGPVCGDVYFYPCVYSSPHTTLVGTGDCCCAQAECCVCCGHGAADGAGAATAGCGECVGGAAAGEECVALLLVAVVVFALVGAVVCVVVGLAYAQKVVRAHWHVLDKYTLASDYVVADLAEGALPLLPGGGSAAEADVEAGGGTFGTALGMGMGSARGAAGGYRPLGSQEPAEDYSGAGVGQGQGQGIIGMVELRNRGVPAVSPLHLHRGMDREGAATAAVAVAGEAVATEEEGEGNYAGASAPYDPHLHRLTAAQYRDLARRGLV